MSITQLLINQLQDVSTRGSLSTAYSCVLLISEFRYYINTTMSLYSIKDIHCFIADVQLMFSEYIAVIVSFHISPVPLLT